MENRRRTPPPTPLSQKCITEESYLLEATQSDFQHYQPRRASVDLPQLSTRGAVRENNGFYCFSSINSQARCSPSKEFPSRNRITRNLAYATTYIHDRISGTILSPRNGQLHEYQISNSTRLNKKESSSPTNLSSDSFSQCDSDLNKLSSAGTSSLRLHLSIDMERRRLKNIRMLAVGITLFLMISSVTCIIYDETNSQRAAEASLLGKTHRRAQEEDKGLLESLKIEFKEWAQHHQRDYDNDAEHEKRFNIWKDNHFRTIDKNKEHGHCKMTKQPVFGSNHFKDLSPEEFKAKYLTGYTGPKTDELGKRKLRANVNIDPLHHAPHHNLITSDGMHDATQISRHQSVQERYLKHLKNTPMLSNGYDTNCYGKTYYNGSNEKVSGTKRCSGYKEDSTFTWTSNARTSTGRCNWYDASCWLQSIFSPLYGSSSGSSESTYNQYSYPTSMDWRQMNAVTQVHSQGSCGACWAITAVETIESVHYIKYGTLLDLSETEIIMCDDTCEMCNGGWPQNAYEFVIENGGALPQESMQYDGDFLMVLSMVNSGESDEMTDSQVESYLQSMCPADNDSSSRYGNIKSYAYATDRCTCYTDGSGCDCDNQNEALAVRNLASYGPATICLDASVWQDYSGGILTSDSGCSAAFLDMNHCVQAVGYAFTDTSDDDNNGSNSNSNSNSGDEDSKREGYWIVRNQWSSYWGMNGYIYIAMGSNTCGVLNDMTQVFI